MATGHLARPPGSCPADDGAVVTDDELWDLTGETFRPGTRNCVVLTGTLTDPYTGRSIVFSKCATTATPACGTPERSGATSSFAATSAAR